MVAGAFIGFIWQILVIFGLHWGLIPVMFNNYATMKYDKFLVANFVASFAQTAVVLAMMIKTRDKKLKTLAMPAFISGICGVTEPQFMVLPFQRSFHFIFPAALPQ